MTHVYNQTSDSDCFRCCLAGLLSLPIEEVPDFYGDNLRSEKAGTGGSPRKAWLALQEWLARRCLHAVDLDVNSIFATSPIARGALAILSGVSPRHAGWDHSVVARWDGEWKIIHDPHPSKAGIGKHTTLTLICVGVKSSA